MGRGSRSLDRATAVAALVAVGSLAAPAGVVAQEDDGGPRNPDYERVRSYVAAHQHEMVEELVELLRLPNVASDTANIRRNARHLVGLMERRGIQARLLETAGNPLVYGHLEVPSAEGTILFYCHYDGQAVDPKAWEGHDPFEPVLRDGKLSDGGERIPFPEAGTAYDPDWRIYARSASDDKSPIVALLWALDALREQGVAPAANLKFVFDGEEETGSPNLPAAMDRYGDLLAADMVIVSDGPLHPSGEPTLVFGVRGIAGAQVTMYGPAEPLHSGHYGNWAPNPAERLAELVATMQDSTGRVTIDGWYEDVEPLGDRERRALERLTDDPREMERLAVMHPEGGGESRWARVTQPSLNVQGIRSGWVGDEARTVIPDVAVANFDFRLVQGIEPRDQVRRFVKHVREQGYHVVHAAPDASTRREHPKLVHIGTLVGYPATRTPMDDPAAASLIRTLRDAVGRDMVMIPTLGGSLPVYLFPEKLGAPFVDLPIVNPDNNQHSPNENLRLGNFFEGVVSLAAAMRARP